MCFRRSICSIYYVPHSTLSCGFVWYRLLLATGAIFYLVFIDWISDAKPARWSWPRVAVLISMGTKESTSSCTVLWQTHSKSHFLTSPGDKSTTFEDMEIPVTLFTASRLLLHVCTSIDTHTCIRPLIYLSMPPRLTGVLRRLHKEKLYVLLTKYYSCWLYIWHIYGREERGIYGFGGEI